MQHDWQRGREYHMEWCTCARCGATMFWVLNHWRPEISPECPGAMQYDDAFEMREAEREDS